MTERTTEPTTAELRAQIRVVYSMPHRAPCDVVGPRVEAGDILRLLDDYAVLEEAAKEAISRNLSYYNTGSQACNAKTNLLRALEGKDAKPVRYG